MPQFLAETIDSGSGEVILAPGEDRHLLLSHRGRVGDTVLVFDGRGTRATATLAGIERGRAILRLAGAPESVSVAGRRHTLLQGLPSRSAFEAIITGAVELGVSRIVPVLSERALRPPRGIAQRRDRWRALVLAAAKQCLRPDLPSVVDPLPLAAAAKEVGEAAGIVLTGPGAAPLATVSARLPVGRPLALAIGPEGGWTRDEIALLEQAGFTPASLGPFVLRCETAALVALGVALQVDPAGAAG